MIHYLDDVQKLGIPASKVAGYSLCAGSVDVNAHFWEATLPHAENGVHNNLSSACSVRDDAFIVLCIAKIF